MSATKTITVTEPSTVRIDVPDPIINTTVTPITTPPVNKPPIANAGADSTVTIPTGQTTIAAQLNASASSDPDGSTANLKYGWRKVSGGNAVIANTTLAVTNVTGLTEGTYVFEVRVTDPAGAFSADTVTITVKKEVVAVNQPPIANAGSDATITMPNNQINLDGTLSKDPDGQIKAWLWKQITTLPCQLTGADTSVLKVTGMAAGEYKFRLTITDSENATNSDEVIVTVKPEIIVNPPVATTYPFTLTQNKTLVKLRHFAGHENWNGQNYAPIDWADYYFRFCTTDIIKGTQGIVDWTRYDKEVRKAIDKRAGMSIGFMFVCDSDDFLALENYGGASSRYCQAWHNKYQAESVKDFVKSGMWIPNWNSNSFQNDLKSFLLLVQDHNKNTVYNGVRYSDIINYVDIRVYGSWGEWHNGGLMGNVSEFPSGTRPTVDAYKAIINAHNDAFPDYPNVVLFAGYDANWLNHTMTPPEIAYYLLTKTNKWGKIGWRRDQWGNGDITGDNYVSDYLEDNFRSFGNSGPFNQLIMEQWKYAPVVGEPYGPGADLSDLKRQVEFYHACSIGNGNYPNNATQQNLFKAAADVAGAKLSLNKGQLKVSAEFDFDITLTAENFGNCPVYNDRLNLVYELRNSSGGVVWTSTSQWKPVLKIPGTYAISDHYKVTTVPTGTYSLFGVIKDNYRALPLYTNEQKTDGTIELAKAVKI